MHTHLPQAYPPPLCQVMFSPGDVMNIFDSESDSDSEDDLLSSRMHTIVSMYTMTCCTVIINDVLHLSVFRLHPIWADEGHFIGGLTKRGCPCSWEFDYLSSAAMFSVLSSTFHYGHCVFSLRFRTVLR